MCIGRCASACRRKSSRCEGRPHLSHLYPREHRQRQRTNRAGREAFLAAKHDQAAAFFYLQALAESTQRLSDRLKANHPEIDWPLIAGFRNRIAHGYLGINREVVWGIIENQLAPLRATITLMLEELDTGE